jgi:hypothetical protein
MSARAYDRVKHRDLCAHSPQASQVRPPAPLAQRRLAEQPNPHRFQRHQASKQLV